MSALTLRNARMVLDNELVHGALTVADGRIAAIDEGGASTGEDLDGDWLLPGFVELHTDHLETHYRPRPGVRWPMTAAVLAHDAQVAAAGITTVLDCIRIGRDGEDDVEDGEMRRLATALQDASTAGSLRSAHLLHLRCEVSAPNMLTDLAGFEADPAVSLMSMMDHTPGERQFASLEQAALYYKGSQGFSDDHFREFVDARSGNSMRYATAHREHVATLCRQRRIRLASHDDANRAHIDEAVGHGVVVAEFPTTLEAATHARAAGLHILMGGPNVVRGQSHSGNVSARSLAEHGLLDILSSDYVPFSLMQAVFTLADEPNPLQLPDAVRLVAAAPAAAIGLEDRGRLALGLSADLVRVHRPGPGDTPIVRAVWRAGRRVV